MVFRRDPKQLRAVDVAISVRNSVGHPITEQTARALAGYFKGGGRDLGYGRVITLGIAVLSKQKTRNEAEAEIANFRDQEAAKQGQEILRGMLDKYDGRLGRCVPIPEKLVRVRGSIGIRLPQGILTRVEGRRRFIIFQPRRGRAPIGDSAGFYLSLFNEKYSVDEEHGTRAEMLDMQTPRGSKARSIRIIQSEDVREFKKSQIDAILAVYASAMERLVSDPQRYGVHPDISRQWQYEMDDIWSA